MTYCMFVLLVIFYDNAMLYINGTIKIADTVSPYIDTHILVQFLALPSCSIYFYFTRSTQYIKNITDNRQGHGLTYEKEQKYEESIENTIIISSYTIDNPWAMMIIDTNTVSTYFAVLGSCWFHYLSIDNLLL